MGANTKLTFALALVECDLKKYFPSNQFCIDPVDMIPLNVFQPPRIAISYFFFKLDGMGFRKIMLIMQPPLMTGVLVWVMDLILLNKIRRKMQLLNGGGPEMSWFRVI